MTESLTGQSKAELRDLLANANVPWSWEPIKNGTQVRLRDNDGLVITSISAGYPVPNMIKAAVSCAPALLDENDRLREENAELAEAFDVQHQRMVEATEAWQAADPDNREGIVPDLGELLCWLLDAATSAQGWFMKAHRFEVERDNARARLDALTRSIRAELTTLAQTQSADARRAATRLAAAANKAALEAG